MHQVYEEFTRYWQTAQQRMQDYSRVVVPPMNWPQGLWGAVPGWSRFTGTPGPSASAWLDSTADQLKRQTLSPAPYLQATRYTTQTAHACLDMQKQVWDQWFALLKRGTEAFGNVPPRVAPASRRNAATRKRKSAASSTPAPRVTKSVQLELEAKDDLKKIAGIGPGLEKKLNQQGIFTYRQIAELTPADVQRLETSIIKFPGRIARDNWIGQAGKLCKT